MKHNWCKANPVREVEMPSDADAQRCNVLSPADEGKLYGAIDVLLAENVAKKRTKEVRGLQDIRDLSILMLNQGCRPEELRQLGKANVDLAAGIMGIEQGKSKAARRMLPLLLASRDALAPRMQTEGPWVFPGRGGKHIGHHQRLWGSVIKKAGLSIVMYDLRHTFATRAIERGVALPKLMAILGHANLRSIMRYVHISQEHITEGMRRFEINPDPQQIDPPVTRTQIH
jgi:integrase